MTPTVRVIETIVVDPPPVTLRDTDRGARRAIEGCGPWPDVGTHSQYVAALRRAGHEIDAVFALWHRYRHRFAPDVDSIEFAPARLGVRHVVALELFQQRAEVVRLLTDEPVAGCA
jgi:hypothetical protein